VLFKNVLSFCTTFAKNRSENNENADDLIQTSLKINVRDLSPFKQFEYDPKHCYSFKKCKD